MSSWTIYGKNGVAKAEVKELELHDEWMAESYLTITVKSAEPIDFAVDDYIDYRGERYAIQYDPTLLKKARSGSYGEGFTYDNIKFVNEAQAKIVRCDFNDIVLAPESESNKIHYSTLPTFPFYCEGVDDLLDRILANLEDLYPGEFTIIGLNTVRNQERGDLTHNDTYIEEYKKWIDPSMTPNTDPYGKVGVALTVDNINCWNALAKVNEDFGLNFILRGYTIIVGTVGVFTSNTFRYGKGNGLYEIERVSESEQQIITRLRAYGSNENLPSRYYANLNMGCYGVALTEGNGSTSVDVDFKKDLFKNEFSSGQTSVVVRIGNTEYPNAVAWNNGVTGKIIVNLRTSYNITVGTKIYFVSGIDKDKWPVSNRDYATENLPDNMAVSRLMLPGFPNQSLYEWVEAHKNQQGYEWLAQAIEDGFTFSKEKYRPYIDSPNADAYGIRPASIYFDGNNETDDIHPTIEGMTYQGHAIDVIDSAEQITDNGVYKEGEDAPNFKITLPNLGFDLKDAWKKGATINMKDGMCSAREFEIVSVKKLNDGKWECTCKRMPDESLDLYFPYNDFQITGGEHGDHYVLTGIDMPDAYVTAASEKLFNAAIEALAKNHAARFTFQPRIDELWMQRQHEQHIAHPEEIKSLHDTLKSGDIFSFADEDLGIDANIIIDVLTIKENGNNGIPTYEVTLRDNKQVSPIQKIQNKVDTLVSGGINGVSGIGLTGSQIQSLIENEGNDLFLSKLHDDEAQGNIGFLQGIWIGAKKWLVDALGNANLNSLNLEDNATVGGDVIVGDVTRTNNVISTNYSGDGIADTGFRLTSDDGTGSSALTVDNLHVRKKATFEELEVKKETAIAGNQVYSAAANVIARTDYYDANGNLLGYSKMKVPWLLRGMAMVLGQNNGAVRGIFAQHKTIRVNLTPAQAQNISYVRCYFLAKDGEREIDNMWKGNGTDGYGHDLARCQTMNLKNSERQTYISNVYSSKVGNVFWWRKVIGVSTTPVTIDEQEYHYIDLSWSDCAAGSDIPAAGDHVVQFGNDSCTDRMHIKVTEINGSDAPADKYYRGIYTYSLSNSFYGGNARKAMISPAAGFEFFGPSFKFVQEYGTTPASIDRGAWTDIPLEPDEMAGTGTCRKCYYYDKVSHNGCYWLCVFTPSGSGTHYVANSEFTYDGTTYHVGDLVPNAVWTALSTTEKTKCDVKQDYTTAEPSTNSSAWQKQVDRGTSVKSVTSKYAKQTAGQYTGNPPTSGWQDTIAAVGTLSEGDYLWTKNTTTYSDTLSDTVTYTVSKWGIDGDGIANIETKFYEDEDMLTQSELDALAETDWEDTYSGLDLNQGDYIYTRTKITYDKGDTPTVSYTINRIAEDGISYVTTEEYYCLGNSNTIAPTKNPYTRNDGKPESMTPATMATRMAGGDWSESRPDYDTSTAASRAKKYLWNFEVCYDTTTNVQVTQPICIANYEKGIASIVETYAISASAVAPQAGGYPADITTWTDEAHDCAPTDAKPYQWNKTVTTYSDGSSDTFYHVSAVKGTKGDSITKSSETYRYGVNSSSSTPPSQDGDESQAAELNKWYTTRAKVASLWTANKYLWTKTIITWSDNSTTTLYSDERNPNDGAAGMDIVAGTTTMTYAITQTNQQPADSAFGAYPSILTQGWYLWSRAETPYYKDHVGGTSAGNSVVYNVSYIAVGTSNNLLYQTQFLSGQMDKWYATNGTIVANAFDGHNGFYITASSSLGQYVQGTGYEILMPSTIYTISFWSKGHIAIDINPGDTGQAYAPFDRDWGRWIDGVKVNGPINDFYYQFTDTDWTHHTITFKTVSEFNGELANLYWHAPDANNRPYICMPKLERGESATAYSTNDEDLNGRAITSVTEYYKASANATGEVAPSDDSGWSTDPNTAMANWNQTNKYLWNYEKVTYNKAPLVERTTPSVLAIWTKDGAAGKGIDSITNYYKVTSSSTAPSKPSTPGTDGWSTTPTAPGAGEYLWNYEVITWVNPSGTTETDVQLIGHSGTNAKYITVNGSCYPGSGSTPAAKVIICNGSTTTTVNWSDCAADTTTSVRRGLALVTIKKSDMSVGTKQFYDTYYDHTVGNSNRCNALATAINGVTTDYFICLMSYDATAWSANLVAALKGCGSRGVENQTTGRYPFAFIGCKGLPEGYAFQIQGALQQTTTVDITAYVASGALVATLDGRGVSSTNIYYTASATAPSTPTGAPTPSGWADDGNTLITKANADANKHLYESTCTTYTDGTYSWTTPLDDGLIADLASTSEEFALADNASTAPTTGWAATVTPTTGKWLWSRTKLTFTSGDPKYVSIQCVGYCGTNGVSGKDGWMVTADPANVLITQSLGTDTTQFSTQAVTFSAKKGSVDAAVTGVLINAQSDAKTGWTHFTGSVSGTTVTVTAPTLDSSQNYYTEGYFVAKVSVTDPDSNTTITFYIKVPCYANLLGSWKRSVEGGVETVVASVVDYDFVDGLLVGETGYSYNSTASAAGSYQTWKTDSASTDGSKANMIQKTTTAQQTADGVVTEVSQIKNGKNLLKGALSGSNFRSESTVPYDNHPAVLVDVDDDGWMNVVSSSHNYICTSATLTRGKTYVLSFYTKTTTSFNIGIWQTASSASGWTNITILSIAAGTSSTRRSVSFTLTGSGSQAVLISIPVKALRYPQLELGSTPTAFEVDSATETSSRISQSAESISLKVKNTGIDIDEKTITLTAEKTTISGDLTVPRVMNMANGMMTTIEAGKVRIESTTTPSYGLFQVNSDGEIILKMVDKDGHVVVNLGGSSTMQAGSWEDLKFKRVDSGGTVVDSIANFTAYESDLTTYHKLTLGRVNNGGIVTYYTPDGNITNDSAVIALDGYLFTGTSNTGAGIKALTKVSGYYVKRNDGVFFQQPTPTGEGGDYLVNVYQYVNGKQYGIEQHSFSS